MQGSAGIKVISKKKIENTPENYEKIKEKFDRIEHLRVAKEKEIEEREMLEKNVLKQNETRVTIVTHINIILYSTCYWIQSGAELIELKHCKNTKPIIKKNLMLYDQSQA